VKKRLNWRIILYDIVEAREQLQQIEARAAGRTKPDEIELQILLEHAYLHLNFAWNVRHQPSRKYAKMDDRDLNRWSRFPKGMEAYKVPVRRKTRKNTNASLAKGGARRRV
jgi:hypothetical protein